MVTIDQQPDCAALGSVPGLIEPRLAARPHTARVPSREIL